MTDLEKLLARLELDTDCDCDNEDCARCAHYPTFVEQAQKELRDMAPVLARKVIAAEKLAEALRGLSSAREAETEYAGRMYTLCSDCGAQLSEDKPHSEDCGWSLSDAALAAWEAAQ